MGYGSRFCLRFDFTALGFQFYLVEVNLGLLGTDFGPFGVDFMHLGVILATKDHFEPLRFAFLPLVVWLRFFEIDFWSLGVNFGL